MTTGIVQSPLLEVHQEQDIWSFTLNRPDKLNALNAELVDALLAAVEQAHARQARLLVFRGAGKSFSAGFDLSRLEEQSEGDLVLRFVRIEMLLQAVANSPAQTLALAHGKVFGAGVDLFAVCRHRAASADAQFKMPGLKFGLVLGTRRFGDIVGPAKARELLEDLSSFSAEQAQSMGFATRLAEPEHWPDLMRQIHATSLQLEDLPRAELYRVLGSHSGDEDLATLTRSAARPGLKNRLRAYLGK
ncbi:enoyl-CoA hydratase/isomerase family protein [Comamonas composti]|uniref:enoyl-CoA hydratase/isomerase family protein n=1 Tax=Comamonas composti TaxID=408558 RepID=UPI000427A65A|nr:enoyl-CoA hydratase/isomerase family protein [Comamonas composti]